MIVKLKTPLTQEDFSSLRAGDMVRLTGAIYTARDAAHKRMLEEYGKTGNLPIDMKNQIIYYAGPAPAKPGDPIGSAGPTTSGRMDAYAPKLMELGLRCMIGKGERNSAVIESMKKNGAVYLGATGGAGALIAGCVKESEVVAYPDLGAEAIHKLYVEDFPLVVIIDSLGNNMYTTGREKYRRL